MLYARTMEGVKRQLKTAGRRRARAREEALRQSAVIKELAKSALAQGMTKAEISEAAQISRPALDAMLQD